MKFKSKYFLGIIRLVNYKIRFGNRMKLASIYQFFSHGMEVDIARDSVFTLGRKNYFSSYCYIGVHDCGCLEIGENNFFNRNIQIECLDSIIIGNNNLFGPNIVIIDHDHRYSDNSVPICRQGYEKGKIVIGNDVWIGSNVTICKGTFICDHVIIGANSFVSKNINESGVYCGNPVRKIKDK